MSKLIVLLGLKARRKRLGFLGYDKLKDKAYEVWDLSAITEDFRNQVSYPDEVGEDSGLVKVTSTEQLERLFSDHRGRAPFYLMTRVNDEAMEQRLLKLIRKHRGCLVQKCEMLHFSQLPETTLRARLKQGARRLRKSASDLLARRQRTAPDHVFAPTKVFADRAVHLDLLSRSHPIHSVNYDKYLEACERTRASTTGDEKPFAVFLAQYLPHHSEARQKYGDDWIEVDTYYAAVRSFFERFLAVAPISTIRIAEHPNADPAVVRKHWEGFDVTFGRTADLVIKSQCVLTHGSSSTRFAVMAEKPTCFFWMPNAARGPYRDKVYRMASQFGRAVNVVGDGAEVEFGLDEKRYRRMRAGCIKTPGTPDINSCEFMYQTLIGS